jgi:DNA-binding transcriptional ArsR family regulator
MRSEKEGRSSVAPARLDERILATLEGLPGRLAFSGLRRVLGAHPESLARALRRLEREGLVERVDGGYRALGDRPRSVEELTSVLRPIASVDLPLGTPSETLLGRLAGHWFGSLRWVGVVERPDGRLLAWARRDGSGYVLLGVDRGHLRVFVPGPREADDTTESEDAAYELLVHAVDALRPTPSSGGGVAFLSSDVGSAAAWAADN